MRSLAITLLLIASPVVAGTQPFTADDLVGLERVSDPQVSPDGRHVAYALRQTDWEGDRGVSGIWLLDLQRPREAPRRLTAEGSSAHAPRWAPDGRTLYFLAARNGSQQVWRLALAGGEAQQVTRLPVDIGSYVVAPDGRRLAVSLDVFTDCEALDCTRQRLDQRGKDKHSGVLYEQLFVRQWDQWRDGRRSQLFVLALDDQGLATGEPVHVSRGLDADIPSRPFGGDGEIAFAPDGRTLVFAARVAGAAEPWSTNKDLYRVNADGEGEPDNLTTDNPATDTGPVFSPDGRTLYYRAMSRPGFESDRYAIMARDLASGRTREVAPDWDRSAWTLRISPDGRTLFAIADELGLRPLFAIDVRSGRVRRLTDAGSVSGFSVSADAVIYAQDSLGGPAQLYRASHRGGAQRQLTMHNQALLAQRAFGAYEQFSFKGAGERTVYGYLVKPVDFQAGQRYPVAFIVHGGPQGSMGDSFHYRWNPQTYAGRGYAVVFIDFHGSTGYGQDFTDSISRDWGGKPLEDLQKGWAHALAVYPFLDGERACALGASYGGYMMNWIAGQWPDGFRCLVNHCGLFDTRSFYYATEELWFPEWEHGGPYFAAAEGHEKHNPVNHVDAWQTPMLVIHNARDYRVPLEQGLAAFTALQRRGIPSQFLYFPDENHWVLKPHNSVQWHQTVEAWLQRWTAAPD